MLRAEAVSFGYDAHLVLHEVSMKVPSGALLGVLGPNGSGKTTLLKLLAWPAGSPSCRRKHSWPSTIRCSRSS